MAEQSSRRLLLIAAVASYIISALIFIFVSNYIVITDTTISVIMFLVLGITGTVIVTEYTTHQPHKKIVSVLGYLSLLLLLPIAAISFVPTITVPLILVTYSSKGVIAAFWCLLADAYGFSFVLVYFAILKRVDTSAQAPDSSSLTNFLKRTRSPSHPSIMCFSPILRIRNRTTLYVLSRSPLNMLQALFVHSYREFPS